MVVGTWWCSAVIHDNIINNESAIQGTSNCIHMVSLDKMVFITEVL